MVKITGGGSNLTAAQAKLAIYSKMALEGKNIVVRWYILFVAPCLADACGFKGNLENILKLLEPAIQTIERMQGILHFLLDS